MYKLILPSRRISYNQFQQYFDSIFFCLHNDKVQAGGASTEGHLLMPFGDCGTTLFLVVMKLDQLTFFQCDGMI